MLNITRPDAIFFDWDDTIINNTILSEATMAIMLHKYYDIIPAEHFISAKQDRISMEKFFLNAYHKMAGASLNDFLFFLFNTINDDLINDYRIIYDQEKEKIGLKIMAYAKDLLELIAKKGIPMAVISNKMGTTLRKEVASVGFDKYFFAIIGSYDCENSKPEIDQFLYVSSLYEKAINPKNTWMIGDSPLDIMAGLKFGSLPFFIGKPEFLTPELLNAYDLGKFFSIDSHMELYNIVKNF